MLNADIAGVRVALSTPRAWSHGPLRDRFGSFPPTLATGPSLEIRLEAMGAAAAGPPIAGVSGAEAPAYPVAIERTGARLRIHGWWLDGWIDLASGQGAARIGERDLAGSLENYLRVAVAHLLLPTGGFLLHATAVVLADGSAVIAFGPSDAGKTTLSERAGNRKVISDDLVALRRIGGGPLVVVPTLFRAGGAPARPEGHPIRGLFRLRQGSEVSVRKLSPPLGTMELIGSMPFVHDDPQTSEAALEIAAVAARDPGVGELTVPAVDHVWDRIEEVL